MSPAHAGAPETSERAARRGGGGGEDEGAKWENVGASPPPPPQAQPRGGGTGVKQRPRRAAGDPGCCQVAGCGVCLEGAAPYHKRYRICNAHFRASCTVLDGVQCRFCQARATPRMALPGLLHLRRETAWGAPNRGAMACGASGGAEHARARRATLVGLRVPLEPHSHCSAVRGKRRTPARRPRQRWVSVRR
jgi:hypothetical protein